MRQFTLHAMYSNENEIQNNICFILINEVCRWSSMLNCYVLCFFYVLHCRRCDHKEIKIKECGLKEKGKCPEQSHKAFTY